MDIPLCDRAAADVLLTVFGFHQIAVRDCMERNHVSKVHIYPEYVFSVLHAPMAGKRGHVHYVELDQFVGGNYLVTVHGPLNPVEQLQEALDDVVGQVATNEIMPARLQASEDLEAAPMDQPLF